MVRLVPYYELEEKFSSLSLFRNLFLYNIDYDKLFVCLLIYYLMFYL